MTLELDKVNAHNTLENAQIALKRAMFSLASFLNLDKNTTIELSLPGRPAAMEIPVDVALAKAKENNPSFLEQRQNILEAEQNVNKTKVESRFNASLNASVGFNQVADKFGDAYRHPLQQDLVSVSVSIPLVDWGVRKGKYNMAKNNLNVVKIIDVKLPVFRIAADAATNQVYLIGVNPEFCIATVDIKSSL